MKYLIFLLLFYSFSVFSADNVLHIYITNEAYKVSEKTIELPDLYKTMEQASGNDLYICADTNVSTSRILKILDKAKEIKFNQVYIGAENDCLPAT